MNVSPPKQATLRRRLILSARAPAAFTLVELMIVMAILTMLALTVTKMVSVTAETITHAEKRIDADAQARIIFDRMAHDFQGMTQRPEVNFLIDSKAGNDALYFFSEATGHFAEKDPFGTSSAARNALSLVGYRVSDVLSNNTRFELERLGRGLHWFDYAPTPTGNSTATCFLPSTIAVNFSNVLSDPYNNSSNVGPSNPTSVPQWDVLGDQVVRLECCLLLKDGTLSTIPVTKPTATATMTKPFTTAALAPTVNEDANAGYSIGSRWYDQTHRVAYICKNPTAGQAIWSPLGVQDLSAVIVAIAVIDGRSRIVADKTALAKIASVLADFDPANPSLMSIVWQNTVTQPGFAKQVGLPASAAAGVRVYQRYFFF